MVKRRNNVQTICKKIDKENYDYIKDLQKENQIYYEIDNLDTTKYKEAIILENNKCVYYKELKDYKYYLISCCSDVIDFEPIFDKLLAKNYDMCDLHLDINKNGLIHIWTNSDKKLSCKYGLNLSSCSLEIVDKNKIQP